MAATALETGGVIDKWFTAQSDNFQFTAKTLQFLNTVRDQIGKPPEQIVGAALMYANAVAVGGPVRSDVETGTPRSPEVAASLSNRAESAQVPGAPGDGSAQTGELTGTATVLTTRDTTVGGVTFGSHSAVHVDNGAGVSDLFDPGASYRNFKGIGIGSDLIEGEADVSGFIKYHEGLGSTVDTQSFAVTTGQADQIIRRAADMGSVPGGFCLCAMVSVLDGIGPFQGLARNVGRFPLPGRLHGTPKTQGLK